MAVKQAELVDWLQQLAPLDLAEDWDNVGLLVQARSSDAAVHRVLLTIDLTPWVMEEVSQVGADFILAYHPPIFGGLKRLRQTHPNEQVILEAIARGIDVYSPHSALDAVEGGVADWLVEAFHPVAERAPLASGAGGPAEALTGPGRIFALAEPRSLESILPDLKAHLSVAHLRVASQYSVAKQQVRTVAICPGAGGSLFASVRNVDLYVTGEMRHHDVLQKVRDGSAVVLTDHTHCERGYLPRLRNRMISQFGHALKVHTSTADRDPLEVA